MDYGKEDDQLFGSCEETLVTMDKIGYLTFSLSLSLSLSLSFTTYQGVGHISQRLIQEIIFSFSSYGPSACDNFEPPNFHRLRIIFLSTFTLKISPAIRRLRNSRRYLATARPFACFQLHPKVNCTAEKKNRVQDCHEGNQHSA